MTYANMASAPTQTAGSSPILASDWNTFVRDNWSDIRAGHVVCTSSTRPSTGLIAGTMVFETDTNKIMCYTGSAWVELMNLGLGSGAYPFSVPVGVVVPFAGGSAPTGWLFCDGGAGTGAGTGTLNGNVGQAYNALYNVIGTTYGGTQAAFNLPNLMGRVPVGAGTGGQQGAAGSGVISGGTALTARTRGQWFGDERLASHNHTAGASNTNLAHSHGGGTYSAGTGIYVYSRATFTSGGTYNAVLTGLREGTNGTVIADPGHAHSIATDTQLGDHSHTITVNSNGSGAQGNLMPSLVLNYIIKF